MRSILFLSFSILVHTLFAQRSGVSSSFDSLLNRGKAEFKKDFVSQNYQEAIFSLQQAEVLNPDNPEVHYFLGYAYSRLNAKDAECIIHMKLSLSVQCSDEMEYLNRLTPKYTGETIILDPYSKITSEWGSMALCYWNNYKMDSVVWAFREGRRRGGFSDFYLGMCRYMLDHCSQKAILMSSGDNLTFSLLYLQRVENYREDVTVLDMSLLHTVWYPKALISKNKVAFDESRQRMDTMQSIPWKETTVMVRDKYAYHNFSWALKPSLDDQYLQRGDRLFLSLLKANEFERDVFFTIGFKAEEQLSLNNHLLPLILLDQVNTGDLKPYEAEEYLKELTRVLRLLKTINKNSADEMAFANSTRIGLLEHVEEYHRSNNKLEAKELFKLLDTYFPENIFPYSSKEIKNYVDHLRKNVKRDERKH